MLSPGTRRALDIGGRNKSSEGDKESRELEDHGVFLYMKTLTGLRNLVLNISLFIPSGRSSVGALLL